MPLKYAEIMEKMWAFWEDFSNTILNNFEPCYDAVNVTATNKFLR
jgi:hypothetical protein